MKAYVNAQKPKTISKVIHHAVVVAKIFASSKGFLKVLENQEKANDKERAMMYAKHIGNKDSKPSSNKKKDNGGYKGQNPLT